MSYINSLPYPDAFKLISKALEKEKFDYALKMWIGMTPVMALSGKFVPFEDFYKPHVTEKKMSQEEIKKIIERNEQIRIRDQQGGE